MKWSVTTAWTTSSVLRWGMWHEMQSDESVCLPELTRAAQRRFVAASALRRKNTHGSLSPLGKGSMRIVAGQAGQRAFALQKATGLAQPVCCACDFKFVIMSGARRWSKYRMKSSSGWPGT